MPVVQKAERLGVCGVVDKHDLVCFAKKVQSDVLEDVLASDVNHVELDARVAARFDGHILERVLAALCHHIVMVELLLNILVNDLRLSNTGLACNDHA